MAAVLSMNDTSRDIFQGYPQHYATGRPRATQLRTAYPSEHFSYASQVREHAQPQPKSHHFSNSPSLDDGFKPSLPSISNLFSISSREQQAKDAEPTAALTQRLPEQQMPRAGQQQRQHSPSTYQPSQMSSAFEARYAPYHRQERSTSSKLSIPPTPPFRSGSVLEGTQSPSTISSGSSLSTVQPYFLASALNNIEATDQRMPPAQCVKQQSIPSQPGSSPYRTSPYSGQTYTVSPVATSARTHYSPTESSYHHSAGMYQQRPLPSNFPPPPPPPPSSIAIDNRPTLPTSNPWEHHHYISSSSQASYPPPQDRYICATCNKAFSRPSSLKIHSHSHTGEKPFKCPHAGCGKAFSVRSNMKRHERGCHARQPSFFSSPMLM